MHLEDTDLISDEIAPGYFSTSIRVECKPHWGYQTKTGSARIVWIPKQLMDRLQSWGKKRRASKLLFGTAAGKPDFHFLDMLKAIAKKAGIDPTTVWLHKFRATAATTWLRSERFGGLGMDVGWVRQPLGHEDMASIEHYVAMVRNEEMALLNVTPNEALLPNRPSAAQGSSSNIRATLSALIFRRAATSATE